MKVFFVLIILVLTSCQQASQEAQISGFTQGTTYHIKWARQKNLPADVEVRKQVDKTLAEIDLQMSNYREDSEISRLNSQETAGWLAVSPEITRLLTMSEKVHQVSEGCYDLTVKPLFDLWGFSQHENRIPSEQEIAAIMPRIGMRLLEIDPQNQRIRKKDPKLKIDLSSIAQGYSVGVVAQRLDGLGISNYMVEIGGEMLVKGRKGDGGSWRIGVETPSKDGRGLQKIITLKRPEATAVMTAGTYRNYFEEQGKTYSHILNPATGKPVDHHLLSVTVIHDDPGWADAWDTALLCAGEDKARQIAEAEQLKVLLLYEQDNQIKEYLSPAYAAWQAD